METKTQNENNNAKMGEKTLRESEVTPRGIVQEITGASASYISEVLTGKKKTNSMTAKLVVKVYDDVATGMQSLRAELLEKYKEVAELQNKETAA